MPNTNDIRTAAALIENETAIGGNTASRVGGTIDEIADVIDTMEITAVTATSDTSNVSVIVTQGTTPTTVNIPKATATKVGALDPATLNTLNGNSLIGGTDISLRTVGGTSVIGSGNIDFKTVGGTAVTGSGNISFKTINGTAITGSGDITLPQAGDSYLKSETYSSAQVDTLLNAKADASNVYTKSQVYTKTEANNLLAAKADASNVYSKTQVYTKTETDNLLANKAAKNGNANENFAAKDLSSYSVEIESASSYAHMTYNESDEELVIENREQNELHLPINGTAALTSDIRRTHIVNVTESGGVYTADANAGQVASWLANGDFAVIKYNNEVYTIYQYSTSILSDFAYGVNFADNIIKRIKLTTTHAVPDVYSVTYEEQNINEQKWTTTSGGTSKTFSLSPYRAYEHTSEVDSVTINVTDYDSHATYECYFILAEGGTISIPRLGVDYQWAWNTVPEIVAHAMYHITIKHGIITCEYVY